MMKNLLFILSLFIFLSSCTSTRPSTKETAAIYSKFLDTHKLEKLNSIHSFRFHGWNSLDNNHLIISTSPKKSYLITLYGYCIDLMYAHHIGINKKNNHTLDTKFDSIIVPGISKSECFIQSIHKLTDQQQDEIVKLIKHNP